MADLFSDSENDSGPCSDLLMLVPGFVRHLNVLRAADGSEALHLGFPFQHRRFSSHASSIVYDIDGDGQDELVQANNKGEIFFMSVRGAHVLQEHTIKVQPLRVHKWWFEGLVMNSGGRRREDVDVSMSLLQTESSRGRHGHDDNGGGDNDGGGGGGGERHGIASKRHARKPLQQQHGMDHGQSAGPSAGMGVSTGWLSPEAAISMELIHQPVSLRSYFDSDEEDSSLDNPFYAQGFRETLKARKRQAAAQATRDGRNEFVFVDSHILATPVIADLDGDGQDELIVSVSYYYDRQFYSSPENRARLDPDIDIRNYIAGGIVVYDIATKEVKWEANMDLAVDNGQQSAYVYASPTVADVDADGNLEVVVGTTLGYIYVLDKHGASKPGWPQQIGPIRGQVLVEDINSDGDMEVCASDEQGTLYCFKHNGELLWKTEIDGIVIQHMSVGDIDHDGTLDIVFATNNGNVWSVRGRDGKPSQSFFPIKTGSDIYAPVTLLHSSDTANHLDIVVPAFDGYMYMIDGKAGQVDKVDFGEHSYAQVLAVPSISGDKINLVLVTMNGNVFSYATDIPYHPLRVVMHQQEYVNGFTSRYGHHGIYVLPESRVCRDVVGSTFKVAFEIVDRRKLPSHIPRQYHVTIAIGNKKVLLDKIYTSPGIYVETLDTPAQRMHANIRVRMVNERRSVFEDVYSVSFNIGFLSLLKWTVVAPVLLVAVVVHLVLDKAANKEVGALLRE